jgi:hypothetical protein
MSAAATTSENDRSTITTVCSEGYEGDYCGSCSQGFYRFDSHCYSCSLSSAEQTRLQFLIAAAVLILLGLVFAVVILGSHALGIFVACKFSFHLLSLFLRVLLFLS